MGVMKELAEQAEQEHPKQGQTADKAQSFPIVMREWLMQAQDQIMAALPDRIDAERFTMVALTAITRNERLRECTPASIFLAVMECARIGLYPDNTEAAIVPFRVKQRDSSYKTIAELIPMVQGVIRLIRRSREVAKIEARVVHEGDEFTYHFGLDPDLYHIPHSTSGPITHAYAVVWWNNPAAGKTFEVMGREELDLVRSLSRAKDSPAYVHYGGEMDRKIVVKRIGKYVDLAPEAQKAIQWDNAIYGDASIGGPLLTDGGPSDDYQNQLIKSRTEAGIAQLKDRLSADADRQEHPSLEQEISQVPPADPDDQRLTSPTELPTDEENLERQFTEKLVDAIVEASLTPNREDAARTLGLSPWANKEVPLHGHKQVLQWFRDFNEFVDVGANQKQAAAKAMARWKAAQSSGEEQP